AGSAGDALRALRPHRAGRAAKVALERPGRVVDARRGELEEVLGRTVEPERADRPGVVLGHRVALVHDPAGADRAVGADRPFGTDRAWWSGWSHFPFWPRRPRRSLAPARRAGRTGEQVLIDARIRAAHHGPFTHPPPAVPTRTTFWKPMLVGRCGPMMLTMRANSCIAICCVAW